MGNGVANEYRKNSTILGDKEILNWQQEKEDLRRARDRKRKERIIDRMPKKIKDRPFSGVETEQLLKGIGLLEIYKRRMRRK